MGDKNPPRQHVHVFVSLFSESIYTEVPADCSVSLSSHRWGDALSSESVDLDLSQSPLHILLTLTVREVCPLVCTYSVYRAIYIYYIYIYIYMCVCVCVCVCVVCVCVCVCLCVCV